MNAAFFTYAKDALPLVQSVGAFRDAGGENVAIFDDAANPLPNSFIKEIAPDLYEQTTFERRGNLIGWPCVFGILDCLEQACESFRAERILKIDSDTMVLDFGWVDINAPMTGFHITGEPYLRGMAYHLALTAIWDIRRELNAGYRIKSAKVEEDTTITTEALALYGSAVRRVNWNHGRAGGWDYSGKTPVEKFLACDVVTFGNRRRITGCGCEDEKRERMALEMARFRRALKP